MGWIAETQAVDSPKNVSARKSWERVTDLYSLTVTSEELGYYLILSPEQPVCP